MRPEKFRPPLVPALPGRLAPQTWRLVVSFLALLACAAFIPGSGVAQAVHTSQDDVEAAYLYDFGKFVQWPGESQLHALNICILGQDPFGPSIDHIIAKEGIAEHPLAVIRMTSTAGIESCAIVFISSSESPRAADEISALGTLPVMTVSDMPNFIDRGGMVQFVMKDNRVRFMVNLDAANKCGLIFSSQLLKVAVSVIGGPRLKAAK